MIILKKMKSNKSIFNRKTICLASCLTLLTACGSDSEFKRQMNDNPDDYLNAPELKTLIVPEGLSVPKQSDEYQISKSLLEGAVGYDLDIRPPVIPKSVIGSRARYNENGLVLTSFDASDWTKISAAMHELNFPITQESNQKIETGEISFDAEDKDGATLGRFTVTRLNENEIAFQDIYLMRNKQNLEKDSDKQRYTLMFYNLIMSEIESPRAKFLSNQKEK